jgi:hypothetical protein
VLFILQSQGKTLEDCTQSAALSPVRGIEMDKAFCCVRNVSYDLCFLIHVISPLKSFSAALSFIESFHLFSESFSSESLCFF